MKRINKKSIVLLLIILALLPKMIMDVVDYSKKKRDRIDFVNRYFYSDFTPFAGIDILKRSIDTKEKTTFLMGFIDDIDTTEIVFNAKMSLVDSSIISLVVHRGDLKHEYAHEICKNFLKLNVSRFSVDNSGNVYVYIHHFEDCSLLRFANENEKKRFEPNSNRDSIAGRWFSLKK